jgi:sulfoxide reductase catalytic subunit YedY
MIKLSSSEITPEHVYRTRRQFLKLGAVGAGAMLLAACTTKTMPNAAATRVSVTPQASSSTDELGDPLNTYDDITNYNNYIEFTTSRDKRDVALLSQTFITSPWAVEVGGLVTNPKTYDIDDLKKRFASEERIYRLRCVEAWSMVVPWYGFSLSQLLNEVEPTSDAQYVKFTTLYAPNQMPGQENTTFTWPYIEGLRLDEAMNDLAILATGLYGNDLPPQDGAPIRLVVPWKYGFKSIKAIVKIELVSEQPTSLWMDASPDEYGFYANVNPDVPHPHWTQSNERRIGKLDRHPTLKFNGHEEEVAGLYAGMDLNVNY